MDTYTHVQEYVSGHWQTTPIEAGAIYSLESLQRATSGEGEQAADTWRVVEQTASGDYSGHGTIGAANYRDLQAYAEAYTKEHGADHPDLAYVDGSCGYHAILFRESSEDEELRGMIDGLEDYPLISDETHSRIEMEWQDDAWKDSLARDFRDRLRQYLMQENFRAIPSWLYDDIADAMGEQLDKLTDFGGLFDLFNQAADAANEYWTTDTASAWFNLDRLFENKRSRDLFTLDSLQVAFDADESYKRAEEARESEKLIKEKYPEATLTLDTDPSNVGYYVYNPAWQADRANYTRFSKSDDAWRIAGEHARFLQQIESARDV